jgi:RNA polymerase subunit RPABC4/transcription elongation factor Spt4
MTGKKHNETGKPCRCPYCDGTTEAAQPLCRACGARIVRCERCGRVLGQEEKICPSCGGKAEEPSPRMDVR